MAERRAKGSAKGVPWDERVVVGEFEHAAEVEMVFPDGPTVTAFMPGVPRQGEVLTARKWRRWSIDGRFRVREVEWLYEGRVPGRVRVHLDKAHV